MLHPEVREINIQLFNPLEKEVFLKAIELMVLFDIKIRPKENGSTANDQTPLFRLPTQQNFNSYNDKSYIPCFEPDIAHVVTFGSKNAFQSNSGSTNN